MPELFALIAPRPMQLQAGDGDGLINEGDRELILKTVRHAYHQWDAEDRFDFKQHPDGHVLRWDLAEGFLAGNL